MKTSDEIIKIARETLNTEANAIHNLLPYLDEGFVNCVKIIYETRGRVVVSGIGKSAIIANKIVSTLNSTGTPSIFMHAGDAIHGDLGTIMKNDIVICISKSGNTAEIKMLVSLLKISGNKIIAMVGNTESFLAKQADFILNATVEKEACPLNLAPTSSTTAQMALGDALAICLLECRGFSSKDFAKFHPGGSLGKKLYLKVGDIYEQNEIPKVKPNDNIKTVILEISSKRLGMTAVVDKGKIIGIITDGDLRRMMEKSTSIENFTAKDIMTKNPLKVEKELMAVEAMELMKTKNITTLLVVHNEEYLGVIHLHDLLKEGIF